MWPDATVFILGGGPSLRKMPQYPDFECLHDKRVIGVNAAFRLGTWIDVLLFGDRKFWVWNEKLLKRWPGLKVTNCPNLHNLPGVKHMKRQSKGLAINPDTLAFNHNSGSCAINLAIHFGAKNIILLGFDMKCEQEGDGLRHHWHDWHQKEEKDNIHEIHLGRMKRLAEDIKKTDVNVLNATPNSAMDYFPMTMLEEWM